jgi:repressor LexA
MRDKGILDGDVVIVRQQDHARDGDTVVALLGDDATVKTYRRTPEGVDLVPGNPEYHVRHVTGSEDFRILGVVMGLVRPPAGTRQG